MTEQGPGGEGPLYLTKIDLHDRRPILETRVFAADAKALSAAPFLSALFDAAGMMHEFAYSNHRQSFDALFGIRQDDPERYSVRVAGGGITRRAPYLVHTGYELPLMLDGRKPLAFFSDEASSPVLAEVRSTFAPFVSSGAIVMAEDAHHLVLPDGRPVQIVNLYFHLPGEEWRLILLRQIQSLVWQRLWRPECEEIEGILLGYSPWENMWWRNRASHLKGT